MIFSVTEVQQQTAAIADAEIAKKKGGKPKAPAATQSPGATDVDSVAEGMKQQWERDRAAKASEIVTEGPGQPVMPSAPGPADAFSRPYLDAGHGAPSPQSEGPRTNPMPNLAPGVVTPVTLPAAPSARNVPQTIAAQFCGGSPSEK